MKFVEEKILKEGHVIGEDILKVDSFVNHRIDTKFVSDISKAFAEEFKDMGINKVVTIETSGIVYAAFTAVELGYLPLVFAKKSKSKTVDESNIYKTEIKSFTRNTVSEVTIDKRFLSPEDRILLVDDFLAEGNAAFGLLDICRQAGAKVVGAAVAIEKSFQGGRARLEAEGLKVYSGANVKEFKDNKTVF